MKTLYPTLCTAALLMLAACTQDPVEDLVSSGNTQSGDLPEGTFIVDYLPSADLPATRGLGEGEAILSLDYLLYTSTDGSAYTLTKHKEISDISADTPWPLTRENMTWAQRQDLKDTLSTGSKYKVVFVANAADEVWKDKTGFQHMTGIDANDNFDDARLLLPPNGDFQQANGTYTFYYMWTGEIDPNPDTNGYDKNTPAQMNVVLQRMVNKVEIRLADEVVQGIESAGSVDAYVTNFLTNYYDTYYYNSDNQEGELYNVVNAYMTGKAGECKPDGGSNQKASKEKFKAILEKEDNKKAVASSITACSETEITESATCCVKHQFIAEMKPTFITYLDWSSITNIELSYAKASYPATIDFNKVTHSTQDGQEEVVTLTTHKDNNSGHYIFYVFSSNNPKENVLNKIQKATFKNEATEEVFSLDKDIVPSDEFKQGNRHIALTFNPTSVTISTNTFQFSRENYNLQDILNWNWETDFQYSLLPTGWHKEDMIKWVNGLFSGKDTDSTFEPYTLELDIPKVEIATPWSTENANQTE